MSSFGRFFDFKRHQTNLSTEINAGLTTFLAMSYIIFINPAILSQTGMPTQAVFLATLISSGLATLFMGLYANVPYALAPGMGLNAFFTYTVCFALGFTWQEALSMVFVCGVFNIIITVTNVRKKLMESIPESLQHAISAGIGCFITYIGFKNANLLQFTIGSHNLVSVDGQMTQTINGTFESAVANGGTLPGLINFSTATSIITIIGLTVTLILILKNVRAAILIGIALTTILEIAVGNVSLGHLSLSSGSVVSAFGDLKTTFGAIFTSEGLPSLFSQPERLPLMLMTVFSFSLTAIFDTLGTFIGTGRRTGIFSKEDEESVESGTKPAGRKSKLERALFGDVFGTIIGAIFGTSNVTTFVESSAGIGVGGRTGMTSVVTAICFFLSAFLAPLISVVPANATAPALIAVGIMMMSSLKDIEWDRYDIAIPAFFASVFMGMAYSISTGIAAGFIFHGLIKLMQGKARDVHPIIWICIVLFLINYAVMAVI